MGYKLGKPEKIIGLTNFSSAFAKDGVFHFVTYHEYRNNIATYTSSGLAKRILTTLGNQQFEFPYANSYFFIQGPADSPYLYLLNRSARNITALDSSSYAPIKRISLDCRGAGGWLSEPHNIFARGEAWHYVERDTMETCDLNSGTIMESSTLPRRISGTILYDGDRSIIELTMFSGLQVKFYDMDLNPKSFAKLVNLPFSDNLQLLQSNGAFWLVGCRDGNCYRATIEFGK